MIHVRPRSLALTLAATFALVAGCGGATSSTPVTTAPATPANATWDATAKAARGTTVNWYLWGGSDAINTFVDTTYGTALKERYDITLKRVPVADTVDAVNQVLAEKQAGTKRGAVDLIWINGENFSTLRQAGMLRTNWARTLPNAALVNWDDPALNRDFGVPVDGMESPWSSAQLQLIADPSRTPMDTLPRSYAAFATWACAHPGRATYIAPGPGGFVGTRFVKGALYELTGGAASWQTFDQRQWAAQSPKLWAYLNELKPCLWRKGATYPRDENEMHALFANHEIDLSLTQAIAGPATLVAAGTLPAGVQTFVFDANMIGDFNYVAIPKNAPHPAAALVLANLILDPAMQAAHVRPESGFGLGPAIDTARITDAAQRTVFTEALAARGDGATPVTDLQSSRASDAAPKYQDLIERGWRDNVLRAG